MSSTFSGLWTTLTMTVMPDICALEKLRRRHVLFQVCAHEMDIAKKVSAILLAPLAAHHDDISGFLPEFEQLYDHILVDTQQDRPVAHCKDLSTT
ncbi:hypothetical protein RI367_007762 [Sorochytrium milnesiophthora]